jgi:hypothetical protein
MKKSGLNRLFSVFSSDSTFSKCVFIIVLGLLSVTAMANKTLATKQQIEAFKNTKTLVVLEDGINFYNNYIKDAVQKYWKSTPYEFIDMKEFTKRKTDPRYSFLFLTEGSYDKDPAGVSYSFISLVLGDASNNLSSMPEFCSIPISYSGDDDADYQYVIPSIVKFIQMHLKNLEKFRLPISINGLKYYNNSNLQDKVLILNKEKMASDADSPEKIKTIYTNKIKMVDPSEISNELASDQKNSVFLFHVGPPKDGAAGRCFEMIFDVEGNLYYYNFRKITNDNTDGFNLNDFKNIK